MADPDRFREEYDPPPSRRVGGIRVDEDDVPSRAELADFAKQIDALSRGALTPAPRGPK